MITPLDIENKEFDIVKKGFDTDQVDDFLNQIILDMEQLIKENKALKSEVLKLKDEAEMNMGSESSIVQTLEAAKELMNDISASSERRAQILLKNAELDAEIIQREARESVVKYTEEGNRLFGRLDRFKKKYRDILQDELERIDGVAEELFKEFGDDFLPASLEDYEEKETKNEVVIEDLSKTAVVSRKDMEKGLSDTADLSKTIVNVR
ncbi:MAG: DivIVA domain-containing protein [Clostridia bacterium]|nr:DivIVA domain-containing protein [Clostridia bacterium]